MVHSILKIEADDDREIFVQGVFAVLYTTAVVTNQELYLGQCKCKKSLRYGQILTSKEPETECPFCGKKIALDPVPRPMVTDHEPSF